MGILHLCGAIFCLVGSIVFYFDTKPNKQFYKQKRKKNNKDIE